MAKTSIVYVESNGRASSVELDAVVSREATREVEVTKFPIEDGSAISDHAIRHPDCYRLEGVVTDMPAAKDAATETEDERSMRGYSAFYVSPVRKYDGTASSARDALERILASRTTVTINTGGRAFSDLVMVSLRFPESGETATSSAVRFSAEFEKIVKVTTETVALPDTKPATTDGGRKPTEKASPPVEEKASVFYKTAHYLRGH